MPDFFKEELEPITSLPIDNYNPTFNPSLTGGKSNTPDFFGGETKLNFSQLSTPYKAFDPIAENYGKFKGSDYYNQLGFLAGEDNEDRYGRVQTFGNKLENGVTGMLALGKHQFIDQLQGWGRMTEALASWDSSKLWGDAEEADAEFKKVLNTNPIFMTTQDRDSIFNWSKVFNTVQQAGFTLGAVAEIAFEELLTFGAASAFQGTKAGKMFKALSMFGTDAAKLGETIAPANKLREAFFNFSKNAENIPFIGSTAKFASEGVGLGRQVGESYAGFAARGFGNFYRDLRELNAAMTEARVEAGGSYSQFRDELIAQEGTNLTNEKLDKIESYAKKAAETNFELNTAIIGISNKIQFNGVFKGIVGAKAMLNESKNIGEFAGKFFKRGLNLNTLKEGITKRPLTYFKNNITEALQENLQESSASAVQKYYEARYKNPGKEDLQISMGKAFGEGLGEQFSKKGFETFLSGFATAAITSPMIGGVSRIYNRLSTTAEQRKQKALETQEQINILNQTFNVFSSEKNPSAGVTLSTSMLMQEAAKKGDKKAFQDAKDVHIRETARTLIETGQKDKYFQMLDDYSKNLTNTEFEETFGVDLKLDGKNSKNDYIESFKSKVEEIEKLNERFSYKFGTNPFSASDPRYNAWNNAKWHVLSTKDSYARAIQRSTELIQTLPNVLQGVNAQSVIPLFDNNLLNQELKLLQAELEVSTDPKLKKQKQKRLELLNKIKEKESKSENPEESYDSILYEKYLNSLVEQPISKEQLQEGLSLIRDVKNLKWDERNLLTNINWLVDPQNISNLQALHLEQVEKMLNEEDEQEQPITSEEPVKTETPPTEPISTGATVQPSNKFNEPVVTSNNNLKDKSLKEFFQQLYQSGEELPQLLASFEDYENLFNNYEGTLNSILKANGVSKEEFLQYVLNELNKEEIDENSPFNQNENEVNKLISIQNRLESFIKQMEEGKELNDNQRAYIKEQLPIIKSNPYLSQLNDLLKQDKKEEVIEEQDEFLPIEGLETEDATQIISYPSQAKTSYSEAKPNKSSNTLEFTSVYDMSIGGLIRFINSQEGREYLEALGYTLKIQKITSDFFNGHNVDEKFVTSKFNPYNFFKEEKNKDVTNFAFVLKNSQGQDVYINPYYFSDETQEVFTTEDKGVKIAINLPRNSVSQEMNVPWSFVKTKKGAIEESDVQTKTSEFLKDTDFLLKLNTIDGFIGEYMVARQGNVRRNGGLYIELPNGEAIKLLPSKLNELSVNGKQFNIEQIINKSYKPEELLRVVTFLNQILQTRSNNQNPFYKAVMDPNSTDKVILEKYVNTEFDGFLPSKSEKTKATTQEILNELNRMNILSLDFSKAREISVPLLDGFEQISYTDFVLQNTTVRKTRMKDPLTGQLRIQTIHDGFYIPETMLTITKFVNAKQEIEELLKCMS
jgi:hypothetical protein